jgi:DNA processing protein
MDDERAYWVLLSSASGIGPIRFQNLLQLCGDARSAWQAPEVTLAQAGLERRTIEAITRLRNTTTPEQALARLDHLGITAVTLQDVGYPENLRLVADPPPVLFARGTLIPDDQRAVALVGTRRASAYGMHVADQLATGLARANVTVVSGLAKGIDTAAHKAALRAGGRTIAVLGNGLDQVYPPENTNLARSITAQGALVSEFAPGIPPDASNFPRRNRIIAGLSRLTVIVEAGERSGAMITADLALEQGRDVLAVPGDIFRDGSAGPNSLLKQGATPVTCTDDILEALDALNAQELQGVARHVPELGSIENTVWGALSLEPRHADELEQTMQLPRGVVPGILAMLELKGLARQAGPMLYTRV